MKRVKIGVVGCGAIAQVHHTPNLNALPDQFKLAVVRDVSPSAAADAARRFHVPRHVTDYRELLAADEDAVLLCHTDPKTEAAIAVLEAGKHLFIEKPLCFSLPDIDAMIAAQGAGTVHLRQFDLRRFADSRGRPEIWQEGRAVIFTLAYRIRAAPAAYPPGSTYPTCGTSRRPWRSRAPTRTAPPTAPSPRWTGRVPTLRELRHFHECIVDGTANRTPLAAPATTSAWSSTS